MVNVVNIYKLKNFLFLLLAFLTLSEISLAAERSEHFYSCRDVIARFGNLDLSQWQGGRLSANIPSFLLDPIRDEDGREFSVSSFVDLDGQKLEVPKLIFDFGTHVSFGMHSQPRVVLTPRMKPEASHIINLHVSEKYSAGATPQMWALGRVLSILFSRAQKQDRFVLPLKDSAIKLLLDQEIDRVLGENVHLGLARVRNEQDLRGLQYDARSVSFLSDGDAEDFERLFRHINQDLERQENLLDVLENASIEGKSDLALEISPLEWSVRVFLIPASDANAGSSGHFAYRYALFLSPILD